MLSAGLRVGSWEHLKWKHVIPKTRDNNIVAAKIILKNTKLNREYFSFITPEAYNALKDWMDFRALHGEQITGESWLVRNNWEELDRSHHTFGMAKFPKLLNASSIRNIINDAWRVQGVRDFLDNGEKRHEFKSTHCFRKFFETKCQKSKMNHNNIKLLMDHSIGESQNYHRPTEQELVDDYLSAVDLLTINEENRLKIKVQKLEGESNEIAILKKQLFEKEQMNYEKLDAKLDFMQREFYQNKVRAGWAGITKEDLPEEYIVQKIQERRNDDKARRKFEKEVWQKIQAEEKSAS